MYTEGETWLISEITLSVERVMWEINRSIISL